MHQKITTENGVQPPTVIFERQDVQVKHAVLRKGEVVPWHKHTHVRDTFYVISGRMTIRVADPSDSIDLGPGDIYTVDVGRPHFVENSGERDMEWVLLQGIGAVDLVRIDGKNE